MARKVSEKQARGRDGPDAFSFLLFITCQVMHTLYYFTLLSLELLLSNRAKAHPSRPY